MQTEVTDSCERLCECWELKSGTCKEEHPVHVIAETLQLLSTIAFTDRISCSPGWPQAHRVFTTGLEPLFLLPLDPKC